MARIIRNYMQLGRVFSAMLTAGIAIIGAYSTGHVLTPSEFMAFMWLGFWFHAFGGSYNELCDIELDSMVDELNKKPLVSGAVSKIQAMSFILMTVFLGALVLGFMFPNLFAILFWVLSYSTAAYYDARGKYTPYMFELSLGLCFLLWALFGALAVSENLHSSLTINTLAVSLVIFVFAVYINWGNAMKDAPTDRTLKVPTRAVVWGYNHDKKLGFWSPHVLYALLIKLVLITAFSLPLLARYFYFDFIPTLASKPVLFSLDIYSLLFILYVIPSQIWIVVRARGRHDREWWTDYIVADIFLTWFAFSFMVVSLVGVLWSLALFCLPFVWFLATTTMIYGKPMRVGL